MRVHTCGRRPRGRLEQPSLSLILVVELALGMRADGRRMPARHVVVVVVTRALAVMLRIIARRGAHRPRCIFRGGRACWDFGWSEVTRRWCVREGQPLAAVAAAR